MLIQPAMNKLSSENYRLKNQNNTPMFRGEFGTKVLKAIEDAGVKDKKGISKVLSKQGIGAMGLVAISKLIDILEAVFKKYAEFERSKEDARKAFVQEKQDLERKLDSQKAAFEQERIVLAKDLTSQKRAFNQEKETSAKEFASQKRAFEQEKETSAKELASQKQALAQQKEEFANQKKTFEAEKKALERRSKALDDKEQSLINVEHLLTQNEIEELQSSIRAQYGIKDPEIKTYDSFGEQSIAVIDIINQNKKCNEHGGVMVSGLDEASLAALVLALQNIDKKISTATLDFLRKITAMHDYDISTLTGVLKILKDDFGDIDLKKSTCFIALYSLDNAGLYSSARNMAKALNIEMDASIEAPSDKMLEKTISMIQNYFNSHGTLLSYAKKLNEYNLSNISPNAIKYALGQVKDVMNKMKRTCCSDSREAYRQLDVFRQKCENF